METEISQSKPQITQAGRRRMPLLARLPWLGILLFGLGAILFAGFAIDLTNHGPLLQEDQAIANYYHQIALADPPVSDAIHISSFWLGREFTEGIAIVLVLFFLFKKAWRYFWMIGLGAAGGGAIWYILTRLFNRPRPSFPLELEHLTDPSFPSGHTLNAVIVFGLIAYLLYPFIRSRGWRILLLVALLAMILFVGYGRVYSGGHYLTDVLSGYAVGLAWAALVATGVDWWFYRRRSV